MMMTRPPLIGRSVLISLARVANALLFVVTAAYCLLSYSPFAYQQFIRPHMVAALSDFVVWHPFWFWLMLGITAVTLAPELRSGRGRMMAWIYLAISLTAAVALSVWPVLPQVDNSSRGLVLALVALLWPLWLGFYDHLATSNSFDTLPSNEGRRLKSAVFAAMFVWAGQLVAIPWRFDQSGDIPLTPFDLSFGIATSGVAHFAAFAAIYVAVLVLIRLGRAVPVPWGRPGGIPGGINEYWFLVIASGIAGTIVIDRLVFGAISFTGSPAWAVAALLGCTFAILWSSIARRLAADTAERRPALDVWLGAIHTGGSRWRAAAALLAVLALGHYALWAASTFDWDFVLQKLCVLAIWLLAFGLIYSATRDTTRLGWSTAGMPTMALALYGGVVAIQPRVAEVQQQRFVPEFVFDGYVGLDTSYRLIRDALWTEPPGSAEFYNYLGANTLLEGVDIPPIDIDFVRPLGPALAGKPNIFLLMVDSLRPDYLSPYNSAVTFTPAIDRFAAENLVFKRAFTRYGGTGLSMPAIWAGSMVIHKQYVLPFHRMNALEKLLDANNYQLWLSMDHITEDLLAPRRPSTELDHGRQEMQYDFCSTLDEIASGLQAKGRSSAPVFAHTRSLNLHVSKLRNRSVPADPAYGGFQGPAAAVVRRIDRCFGGFIDVLKRTGLYDNSIVVLTSDHGDSLGEGKRWGHAMTLFPEVIRVPLIVHVPAALGGSLPSDTEAVSFSTDITPTLYALLGYSPASDGPLQGTPLVGAAEAPASARRRESYLLASSYGPVYGLLQDNGHSLYIVDAVNRRDYKYDLSKPSARRVGVSSADREAGRSLIRENVHDLAARYHFAPQP